VGTPDNYKQMYENAVAELNKRGTMRFLLAQHDAIIPQPHLLLDALSLAVDEAVRLRAALRMQGEEDVAKFRHLLMRELSAERERLQRILDSKVSIQTCNGGCRDSLNPRMTRDSRFD
jgi:hypothetical protein